MKKKFIAVGIAASLLAGPAWGQGRCAGPEDELAMKTSAMQQALMVAALACNDVALYNHFVIAHRGDLMRADAALLHFFVRERGGEAAYHAFKTKAANVSSLESARDNAGYCTNAGRLFEAARGADDFQGFVAYQWRSTGEFIRARCTVSGAREAMAAGVSRLFEASVPASPNEPGMGGQD